MQTNWMRQLAVHYERTRKRYPDQDLMIVFDIDGTIVDMRHMIMWVLRSYDRTHNTSWFRDLTLEHIAVHEDHLEPLLVSRNLPPSNVERVLDWYRDKRWSERAILASHRPYHGVLEVIRWFQLQPRTFVALNSGRPERLRAQTLRSLNQLGHEYRVRFSSELTRMHPDVDELEVRDSKVAAIRSFEEAGYRVFAFVDNEPDNLRAVAQEFSAEDVLLLHADTIFESQRARIPANAVTGSHYDITELINERSLPQHVQLVWRGVNDAANLRQFLGSNVHWAEIDVRIDPASGRLVLQEGDFAGERPDEEPRPLEEILGVLRDHDAGVQIDLRDGGVLLSPVFDSIDRLDFPAEQLWFNGKLEELGHEGIQEIAQRYPGAIVQCPIDFLAPLVQAAPEQAQATLSKLAQWGANRFSLGWRTPASRQLFDHMDRWGFWVNIDDVPDLQAFLQATLMLPRSITSDFNFPKWYYFGLGAGDRLRARRYAEEGTEQRRIA